MGSGFRGGGIGQRDYCQEVRTGFMHIVSDLIVCRRENTGGRKKKRESVDSDADAEQEDAAIVMPAQSPSSDSESSLSLDSGVHPSEAPMPLDDVPPPPGEHQLTSASLSLLRLVASGTPMILWIDVRA